MNVLEKIFEEIEDHAIEFESFGMCDDYVSVGWVKEVIRSHMDEAKDAKCPSNDGWIQAEDELPKETGYYLVQLSRKLPNEDYSDRVVVLFNGIEKEFMCYANLIIAWRPLPEPYRSEESKSVKNTQQEMEDFWRDKQMEVNEV